MNDQITSYANLLNTAAKELMPINVQFELTHVCNLDCVHCFIARDARKQEMSTDEICSVLDQIAEQRCLFLTLTGGEILTREDFFVIAEHAGAKGFALRLLTNGTLVDPEVADSIAALAPLSVGISLYGVHAEIHDAITRVPGSFAKTIEAIHLLKQRDVPIILKTPVMSKNVIEYKLISELAEELGAGLVVDPSILPRADGSKDTIALRIGDEELHSVLSYFASSRGNRGAIRQSRERRLSSFICAAARRTSCILPYGEVFPCSLWRVSAGNLRKETFKEIWESSALFAKIRSMNMRDLSTCANCGSLSYCNPCIGQAILEDTEPKKMSLMTCRMAEAKRKIAKDNASVQPAPSSTPQG